MSVLFHPHLFELKYDCRECHLQSEIWVEYSLEMPELLRAPSIFYRVTQKDTVTIVALHNQSHFYELEGYAAEFWKRLDGKKSHEKIIDEMIERYDLPPKRFRQDIAKLIRDLLKEKLLIESKAVEKRARKRA